MELKDSRITFLKNIFGKFSWLQVFKSILFSTAGNSPQISAQIQQVLSPDSKSVFSFILQTWVVVCQIWTDTIVGWGIAGKPARSEFPNIIEFLAVSHLLKKLVFIASFWYSLPIEES